MSWLEIIGSVAIFLYMLELYKKSNPSKFSKDPEYNRRENDFKRMNEAFGKLHDLRDMKIPDTDNINISNIQSSLDLLIDCTVPMPKESFASDYRSRYVDYLVIESLSSAIINSEASKKELKVKEITI